MLSYHDITNVSQTVLNNVSVYMAVRILFLDTILEVSFVKFALLSLRIFDICLINAKFSRNFTQESFLSFKTKEIILKDFQRHSTNLSK